ncbi:hypothetical protein ATCV1_z155L [Acanthocystis turfacea chlorella virus 1]|uniref:Uncharacterized protein z155L n=1 Tax=Chlorovirus heliozoae TaxID=322019 RepID=A7K8B5_9PHYC|nr:hypothetical protein ATCV1_z155L [Acanthocystis turfacea chlorella virus 1]ABT16289.1 hypothetical protein ATCV1_z155L [Acanthocystis turfacea chlorella virus 1]
MSWRVASSISCWTLSLSLFLKKSFRMSIHSSVFSSSFSPLMSLCARIRPMTARKSASTSTEYTNTIDGMRNFTVSYT